MISNMVRKLTSIFRRGTRSPYDGEKEICVLAGMRFRICDDPTNCDGVVINLPEGAYSVTASYRRGETFVGIHRIRLLSRWPDSLTTIPSGRVTVDSGSAVIMLEPSSATRNPIRERIVEINSEIMLWVLTVGDADIGVRMMPPFGDGTYKINMLLDGMGQCGVECDFT